MTTVTVDRAVLEQALEALEQCGLGDTHRSYEFEHAARAALSTAVAQQAEPVAPGAWVASKDGRVIYDDASTDDGLLRVSGDFENDEQRVRYAQRIVDKLNAAPPQREPVLLTDEEIDALPWNGSPRQFARAVEKTSWEKNHGQA